MNTYLLSPPHGYSGAEISTKEQSTSQRIRSSILKMIKKAKRAGFWKKMEAMDRSFLELSSRLKISFRSLELLRVISRIAKEIASVTSFVRRNYLLGVKPACKIAEYAVSLGYLEAMNWVKEKTYVVWWGIFCSSRTYTM
jgi:hypothetical protein